MVIKNFCFVWLMSFLVGQKSTKLPTNNDSGADLANRFSDFFEEKISNIRNVGCPTSPATGTAHENLHPHSAYLAGFPSHVFSQNYRPISLLCVPFKLLERLLLVRLEPIIDPQLPNEQAGFRRGRSTVHQIVNLTDDIEEAFEKGHKAGVILVGPHSCIWHGMAPGSYPEATTYHPRSSSRAVHLYYHL